jgi:YidC/Oxa1 family membrane protein insertase
VENQRNLILAIVLSALVLLGWSTISSKYFPVANPPATKIVDGQSVAVTPANTPAPTTAPVLQDRAKVLAATSRVVIQTPKLKGSINLTGARIDDLVLSTYRETIEKNSPPIRLLAPDGSADAYYAGFGWTGDGRSAPNLTTVWQADGSELTPGKPVTLRWQNASGQIFALKFSVDANFMFTVEQSVANAGSVPFSAQSFAYIGRAGKSKDPDVWTAHVGPIGVSNHAANYDINFDNLTGSEPGFFAKVFGTRAVAGVNSSTTTGGWLGFGDKFWLTALVMPNSGKSEASFRATARGYQADFKAPEMAIQPGMKVATSTRFFAGAKEVNTLDGYETSLDIPLFGKGIDWGWFEIVEKPIFHYLHWLFGLVGNFGVAIMLLTLTVRGLMFPVAQRQFASMAGMRVVQPKMKAIQERYKDDKARQQQEIMALYKAEKVNPLAGCLPIFLQIPIFYALYKVLVLTIEMRHQPFVLWIKDLSAPDPLTPVNLFGLIPFTVPHAIAIGVLPILVGVTQYMQFKLNPTPMDAAQAQVFKFMPWILVFVMAPFAAGLQLYWMTSNTLTILQQKWLYSRHPGLNAQPAEAK